MSSGYSLPSDRYLWTPLKWIETPQSGFTTRTKSVVSLGSRRVDHHPGWGEATETPGPLCAGGGSGFCSCRASSSLCPAHMGPNLTQEVNVRVPWLSFLSEFYFLFLGYWVFLPHYHPSIPSAFCLLFFLLAWTCPPGLHFLSFPSAGLNLPEYPVGGGGSFSVLEGMFEVSL